MHKVVKILLIVILGSIVVAGVIIGVKELAFWSGNEIAVASPDSTTVWQQSDFVAITWTWSGEIDHVNIYLKRPSYSDQEIVSGTQCDGLYYWTVPWSQEPATNYQVKIESELGDAYDESDFFEIKSTTAPPPTTTTPPTTTPPTTPEDTNAPVLRWIKFRDQLLSSGSEMPTPEKYSSKNKISIKVEDLEKRLIYTTDYGYAKVLLTIHERLDAGGRSLFVEKTVQGIDLVTKVTAWDGNWGWKAELTWQVPTIDWGASYEVAVLLVDYQGNDRWFGGYSFRYIRELTGPTATTLEQISDKVLISTEFDEQDRTMIDSVYLQLENAQGERYLHPYLAGEIFQQEMGWDGFAYSCYFDSSPWGTGEYHIVIVVEYSNYADFRVIETAEFSTDSYFIIDDQPTGHTSATDTSTIPGFTFLVALVPLSLIASLIICRRKRKN